MRNLTLNEIDTVSGGLEEIVTIAPKIPDAPGSGLLGLYSVNYFLGTNHGSGDAGGYGGSSIGNSTIIAGSSNPSSVEDENVEAVATCDAAAGLVGVLAGGVAAFYTGGNPAVGRGAGRLGAIAAGAAFSCR